MANWFSRYRKGFGQRKPGAFARIDTDHDLANGMLGCWLFNQGGGTTVCDLTKNANSGILNGSVSWSPGKFGNQGLNFAASSYVNIPSVAAYTPSVFSVSFWLNSTAATVPGAPQQLHSLADVSQNGIEILGDTNSLRMQTVAGGSVAANITGSRNVFDGLWHHCLFLVTTASSGNNQIYLDGTLEVSGTNAIAWTLPASPMRIAKALAAGFTDLVGSVDHLVWWNRLLLPGERATLYQSPFAYIRQPGPAISFFGPSIVYSINAAPATFSLTGDLASLSVSRKLNASSATFSLSGTVADLSHGYKTDAVAGAISLTGSASKLQLSRNLDALPGTFTLTGHLAGLDFNRKFSTSPGTFTLSGSVAKLLLNRNLDAVPGAFALNGSIAKLLFSRNLNAGSGSFVLNGYVANLHQSKTTLAAGPGAFSLTGSIAKLWLTRKLNAGAGSLALSGSIAKLLLSRNLAAGSGTFALSGLASGLLVARKLNAGSGAFSLNGSLAGLFLGRRLNAGFGSLVLTGAVAKVLLGRNLAAAPGSFRLSGTAAGFSWITTGVTNPAFIFVEPARLDVFVEPARSMLFIEPVRSFVFYGGDLTMATIAKLAVDAGGTSESVIGSWDFVNLLSTGESVVSSPAPVFTQSPPSGQPLLTLGALSISGTQVQCRVSITGGKVGTFYDVCCRATTSAGNVRECFGSIQIIGL